MKCIEIRIDPTGAIQLQTQGYSGEECRAASAELEKALGLVQSDRLTAELYQSPSLTTQQQATGS